tara:strand:- start:709 stop:828 length:120 start_codon:yes stop_codon:yes gene_type:complete
MWSLYPRKPARVMGNIPNILLKVVIIVRKSIEDKENREI